MSAAPLRGHVFLVLPIQKKKEKPYSYILIRFITHAFPNRPTHKYLPLTESHQYGHRPTQNWKEGFLNVAEWGVVEITWQDQRETHWFVQDYGCRIVTHLICESIGFNYKMIGWASLF